MAGAEPSISFAELGRELPKLTPAERVCVLAWYLNMDLENLSRFTHWDSRPEWAMISLDRMIECLNKMSAEFVGPANLELREVYAEQRRLINFGGKAWGNYCEAIEHIAEDYYSAIYTAADASGYRGWLINRKETPTRYSKISPEKIQQNWSDVVQAVKTLPVVDFDELRLSIENESIEIKKRMPDGSDDLTAITKSAASVLLFLAAKHPVLQTLDDIEGGADVARATANKAIAELTDKKLAKRSEGAKSGATATAKGLLVANKISTSSA